MVRTGAENLAGQERSAVSLPNTEVWLLCVEVTVLTLKHRAALEMAKLSSAMFLMKKNSGVTP